MEALYIKIDDLKSHLQIINISWLDSINEWINVKQNVNIKPEKLSQEAV